MPLSLPGKSPNHWAVKGDQAGFCMDGHQKGCDIAVTYNDFWVFPDQVVTDPVKEPEASVTATGTENGLYLLDPATWHAGRPAWLHPFLPGNPSCHRHGVARRYPEPGGLQYLEACLKIRFVHRAGRRDNAYPVSFF